MSFLWSTKVMKICVISKFLTLVGLQMLIRRFLFRLMPDIDIDLGIHLRQSISFGSESNGICKVRLTKPHPHPFLLIILNKIAFFSISFGTINKNSYLCGMEIISRDSYIDHIMLSFGPSDNILMCTVTTKDPIKNIIKWASLTKIYYLCAC